MKYKLSDLINFPEPKDEWGYGYKEQEMKYANRGLSKDVRSLVYNKLRSDLANMEITIDEENIISLFLGFMPEADRYNFRGEDLWKKLATAIASELPKMLK